MKETKSNEKHSGMFGNFVCLIDEIKENSIGEWFFDKQNDGSPEHPKQMPFVMYSNVVWRFENAAIDFIDEHPEYGLCHYSTILKRNDIDWETESMSSADVSNKDAQCVMALITGALRAEHFCDGALKVFFENGSILRWLCRLRDIELNGEVLISKCENIIELINGSCADQNADIVVNAANANLWAGGGICGVIFKKAGMTALTEACKKYKTPLSDGDAVITPAFDLKNAKAIIHAVGPNFNNTPKAFKELFDAYYNSLVVMKDNEYHSISFPLISAGIFSGSLDEPAAESTKQCCRAYRKFCEDYPTYFVNVKLCAFSQNEMTEAKKVFDSFLVNLS